MGLFCQNICYETFYGISSMKDAVQRIVCDYSFCPTLYFILNTIFHNIANYSLTHEYLKDYQSC